MKTLEELSEEIEKVGAICKTNIDDLSPSVRGGWSTRITESKVRLKELLRSYKALLLKTGVAIFIEGDPVKAGELAKLVREDNEALVVDAGALYVRLAGEIKPTVTESGSQWGIAQTHRLHLGLKEVMEEVGLSELDLPPTANEGPYVKTTQDIIGYVRKFVRSAVGDNLNRLYIENQLAKEASEIRYIGALTPVLILNAAADERKGLAFDFAVGSSTVNLTSEDNIDREFMVKTLKTVNADIRTEKPKTATTKKPKGKSK